MPCMQAPRRVGGAAAAAKAKALGAASGAADSYQGTFVWRIEHFTRLKDLLKKRKITGLCIKSRRFAVGGCTCRLIVYPRGQSQPPRHLSMFLEVSEREGDKDWSAFVSHRLVIVNQRDEQRSLVKESQVPPCSSRLPCLQAEWPEQPLGCHSPRFFPWPKGLVSAHRQCRHDAAPCTSKWQVRHACGACTMRACNERAHIPSRRTAT